MKFFSMFFSSIGAMIYLLILRNGVLEENSLEIGFTFKRGIPPFGSFNN